GTLAASRVPRARMTVFLWRRSSHARAAASVTSNCASSRTWSIRPWTVAMSALRLRLRLPPPLRLHGRLRRGLLRVDLRLLRDRVDLLQSGLRLLENLRAAPAL